MTDLAGTANDERYLATLGRLMRGALHEIANPLLALGGSAELALIELEPGTKLHGRIETVQRTGGEIAQIVRALQRFVRLRNEPPRRLSLAQAAEDAVSLVRLVNPMPDVVVSARLEAQPYVHEAPGRVAAGLVELLIDAVATAARGDAIELVVREEGSDALVTLAGGRELRLPKAPES